MLDGPFEDGNRATSQAMASGFVGRTSGWSSSWQVSTAPTSHATGRPRYLPPRRGSPTQPGLWALAAVALDGAGLW